MNSTYNALLLRIRLTLTGCVLAVLCGIPAAAQATQAGETLLTDRFVPLSDWWISVDDQFVVDTQNNIGYLRKTSGVFTSFRVVTGQRAVVSYIGRTYRAATPDRKWTVLSKVNKGDKITFGKRGLFLRLTDDSDGEETAYGIHSHYSADTMLAREDRYASMGCIIVSEDVLTIIDKTFEGNGQKLRVTTIHGMPVSLSATVSAPAAANPS